MKKMKIIAVCLAGLMILTSCDKFLELTPRDTRVVSTVEDYRDILASYMRLLKTPNRSQENVLGIYAFTFPKFDVSANLGIYTGETNLNIKSSYYYDKEKNEYTKVGKNLVTWLNTDPYIWDQYYEFLGVMNLIVKGIETATGKDEETRRFVKGEALVWRAFGYFKLLQYYSPYKDNTYGIPVYLTPDENIGDEMPARKTQKEVFGQILDDCREALELMEQTSSNQWNCAWRYDFVNAMMASVYTWKAMSGAAEGSDWGNAEKCATEAMRGHVLSSSPEILRKMFNCRNVTTETDMTNDEFYFRIMDGDRTQVCNYASSYYENSSMVDGKSNPDYFSKFDNNDIRKGIYFTPDGIQSDKYNLLGQSSGGCIILFRLAEMYLIKAEALVRQGNAGEAKKVMEDFKQARYTGEFDVPSDTQHLLQEILDERLREFYMENDFRWLDMKRLGVKVTRIIQGETFVLEPDDFRYCFPIPRSEIEVNKNMVQTPGWDKVILD